MSVSPNVGMNQMSAIKPRQKMRGHTQPVEDIVPIPDRKHIITSSHDGSLRLWDLESGAQIGNDWRDDVDKAAVDGPSRLQDRKNGTQIAVSREYELDKEGMTGIALSPNGKTVAGGSTEGTVRLWDMETKKVIARWTGHTRYASSVCWSPDSKRVATASYDETIRVWDVESGETVLGPIKTGNQYVNMVAYSPDASKIATGGFNENGIKIWNATTDQKKLISASFKGSITIFNTATWHKIATLTGHQDYINGISLFQNNRLLASASVDGTARLWNLDTNLQVGPPLQHEQDVGATSFSGDENILRVYATSFSGDGNFLVTGCNNGNTYVWNIHAILKEAGLEDLLSPQTNNVEAGKSIMASNASRHPVRLEHPRTLPRGFFDDTQDGDHSVAAPTHPRPSTRRRRYALAPFVGLGTLPGRVSLRFRRSQPNTDESIELQQPPRQTLGFDRGPPIIEVPVVRDKQTLYVAPRPQQVRKRMRKPTWWSRCILFICCVCTQETDGDQ